jgi:maltose alpha-D-glucosyltransferase/alpha-amylase
MAAMNQNRHGLSPNPFWYKSGVIYELAEMIRSFRYAAHAALLNQVNHGTFAAAQMETLVAWSQFWSRGVGATFYKTYRQAAGTTAFLPPNEADVQIMMDACLLRKAIYELRNELNHRPDWVAIPVEAILGLIGPVEPA